MGITLAAFTIHALTSDIDKWGGEEYPSIAVRIQTMIGGTTFQIHRPSGVLQLVFSSR